MLECEFAEIEDVGVALPDCARCTPVSIIFSPDNPGLQDCYIVIALTSSCWRHLYGSVVLPAVGSLSIKGTYFQCSVT